MIETLIEAFNTLAQWPVIGWVVLGVLLGIIIGSTPGIGTALGMAIILPLTIRMDPINAFVLLIGIYSGGMYGGSIPAILLNAPGTAAAAATTLEGYPMSRNGEALTALSISAVVSAVGGFIAITLLILISPIVINLILLFGSPEYFLIALLGLAMITLISREAMLKGILTGVLGLAITTVGLAPATAESRYTFGQFFLIDGISFIAILIGIFAISEMLILAREQGEISGEDTELSGSIRGGVRQGLSRPLNLIKSTLIGMGVGAIPGAGGSISTFVAYGEALRSSKDPDSFGKGNYEGLIAAEASNNATISGSLIPTLSFAIPGSGSTAVLLGALVLHGIQPGPNMFGSDLDITFTIFLALLLGNLIIILVGILVVTRASYLTKINVNYIIPTIIILSICGGYMLRETWLDVATVLLFGILGYYMKVNEYPVIPLILGTILGPIAEENLLRSLQLSDGSLMIFVSSPQSILIVLLIVIILLNPFTATIRDIGEKIVNN